MVTSTYSETDTSSDAETDTSSETADNHEGTTTETEDTTSDGSGMESSTETSSGTDTFSGIEEEGSDYWGDGSFTENSFDSTTYTNHDNANTTTDASGLLNGTTYSSDDESDTWSDGGQDVDSISTSGDDDEADTVTVEHDGSTINGVNDLTSYVEGVRSEQGGPTVQTTEIDSISDTDPYYVKWVNGVLAVINGSENAIDAVATKAAAPATGGTKKTAPANQPDPGRPLTTFQTWELKADYGTHRVVLFTTYDAPVEFLSGKIKSKNGRPLYERYFYPYDEQPLYFSDVDSWNKAVTYLQAVPNGSIKSLDLQGHGAVFGGGVSVSNDPNVPAMTVDTLTPANAAIIRSKMAPDGWVVIHGCAAAENKREARPMSGLGEPLTSACHCFRQIQLCAYTTDGTWYIFEPQKTK